MVRRLAIVFVAASSLCPAYGYGPIGHQIVGAIADRRLANTPAGAKVSALINGFTLEKAAVIADEIKGWDKRGADDPGIFHYTAHPEIDRQLCEFWKANPPTKDRTSAIPSHHWFHYTDVPVASAQRYHDDSFGRSQWDIVHMVSYCAKVLRGDVPQENDRHITKAIAVILLAHFLGDIHQPLHVGAEYFDKIGSVVANSKGGEAYEDQGGNSFTLTLRSRLPITGNINNKLHGFWDNDCVMVNLPAFPEAMPKEERRLKMDEARQQLAVKMSQDEPKAWRIPIADPDAYAEALANDILPIAREAHERLRFRDVRQQQDEGGNVFVSGVGEEKEWAGQPGYAEWSRDTIRSELHKAGWRLADLLQQLVK